MKWVRVLAFGNEQSKGRLRQQKSSKCTGVALLLTSISCPPIHQPPIAGSSLTHHVCCPSLPPSALAGVSQADFSASCSSPAANTGLPCRERQQNEKNRGKIVQRPSLLLASYAGSLPYSHLQGHQELKKSEKHQPNSSGKMHRDNQEMPEVEKEQVFKGREIKGSKDTQHQKTAGTAVSRGKRARGKVGGSHGVC